MDKKKKKQLSFLYINPTKITPKEYRESISSGTDIEVTGILKEDAIAEMAASDIDNVPFEPSVKPAQDDQTIVPPREYGLLNNIIVNELEKTSLVHNFFHIPEIHFTKNELNQIQMKLECPNCLGTYADLIRQGETIGKRKEDLDNALGPLAAQRCALLLLWVKASDAHGGTILIQQEDLGLSPLPVNYTNCLGKDPNSELTTPRTTRWETWPALARDIDNEIKRFVLEADPELTVKELKGRLTEAFGSQLTPEQKISLEVKLIHLQCNMVMVQEAVREGLNFRQIIALILPKVNQETFAFVTSGVLEGGELWPARKRFTQLPTAFLLAWNAAKRGDTVDVAIFTQKIKDEIKSIKKMPADKFEKEFYDELAYELRRGLFL